MKKTVLVLMVGLLLIGVNAFAAGDLIVDGKLGVGTTGPNAKGEFVAGLATDKVLILKGAASQSDNLLEFQDSAGTVLSAFDSAGRLGIGTATPDTALDVRGKTKFVATPMVTVFDAWGDIFLFGANVDGNARTGNWVKTAMISGPTYAYNGSSNLGTMLLFRYISNSTKNMVYFGGGTSQAIAATDIYFNTQTSLTAFAAGTNRLHIDKDGNIDIPADSKPIRLGAGQDATIYYDGTNLVLDPNVVGTGKVYIGATGNDTINAGAYEVGGVAGLNQIISVRKGDDTGACTITITNGIITATTC